MRSILILAVAACCASPAVAGSIRGSVRVPPVPPHDAAFRPYAGRASSLPAPVRPARGLVTDAVLFVDAIPGRGAGRPAPVTSRPQLAQRGQAFDPRVVVVAAGGEVDFPNFDPIYHNVFSVSPLKRFDLGKYPRGQSRRVQFPKPGLINVFCDIHSDMSAFILVTPTPAWARPSADGHYELTDLPAGRYHLRWWHPDFGAGETDVEVPATGAVELGVEFR